MLDERQKCEKLFGRMSVWVAEGINKNKASDHYATERSSQIGKT